MSTKKQDELKPLKRKEKIVAIKISALKNMIFLLQTKQSKVRKNIKEVLSDAKTTFDLKDEKEEVRDTIEENIENLQDAYNMMEDINDILSNCIDNLMSVSCMQTIKDNKEKIATPEEIFGGINKKKPMGDFLIEDEKHVIDNDEKHVIDNDEKHVIEDDEKYVIDNDEKYVIDNDEKVGVSEDDLFSELF